MKRTIILLMALMIASVVALGHIVHLWDGTSYRGEIVGQDEDFLYLKTGILTVEKIPQDEIKRISLLSTAPAIELNKQRKPLGIRMDEDESITENVKVIIQPIRIK